MEGLELPLTLREITVRKDSIDPANRHSRLACQMGDGSLRDVDESDVRGEESDWQTIMAIRLSVEQEIDGIRIIFIEATREVLGPLFNQYSV